MKEILLTKLRDRTTPCSVFRSSALELADLLAAEAASSVPVKNVRVQTPVPSSATGVVPEGRVALIAILRSGLALIPAFMKLFPEAPIGFFGMRRDEEIKEPCLYYENIPHLLPSDHLFLLDPMIATGGSASLALEHLSLLIPPTRITLVGILSSTPGVQKIKRSFPVVRIITAAEDAELDAHSFIVPGLGDFGDRFFGTGSDFPS